MPAKKYFTEEEKKSANNDRSRKWQKENKERAYTNHARYRDNNRDRVNLMCKISRENTLKERLVRRRARSKERKESDPIYRISENIRVLVIMSFKSCEKGFKKNTKTEKILGCSIPFLIEYILSKCPEGITLKDFGRYGYHIDHIIPISTAKTQEDVVKLNHYTNLQPLFWRDNISKRDKIII